LQPGTTYDVQMVAWRIEDGSPVYSELSNIATGSTSAEPPPTTPTVDRVVASPSSVTLDQGETYALVAVAYDAVDNVVSTPIEWTSTNPSVAGVAADGTVTAQGAGTALLIASALCCSAADTTAVTVNSVSNPPPPPPPPPSGAWYTQNWSTINGPEYEHTTPNPAAGDVSLLTGLSGPGGFTNAMRVTYFANQGREPLAGITLQMPRADTDRPREAWIEFYARWSPNFSTDGPYCTGAKDHKFFFIFQNDRNTHPFTFRSHIGVFGDQIGHYIDGSGLNHPGATTLFDGQWHKVRYHAKIDPVNPEWDIWINGQKYTWVDASNINPTSDDAGNYLKYLVLSRNMNCGVAQDMTIDYGPVTVYVADPGW
ncbi:MAG: Ig-like domain-containing protein, partial [Longimicrobiales bacterium]